MLPPPPAPTVQTSRRHFAVRTPQRHLPLPTPDRLTRRREGRGRRSSNPINLGSPLARDPRVKGQCSLGCLRACLTELPVSAPPAPPEQCVCTGIHGTRCVNDALPGRRHRWCSECTPIEGDNECGCLCAGCGVHDYNSSAAHVPAAHLTQTYPALLPTVGIHLDRGWDVHLLRVCEPGKLLYERDADHVRCI